MLNYKFFVTADVIEADKVYDLEAFNHTVLASEASEEDKLVKGIQVDVESWLPQASKIYNISKDLNDYVVTVAEIMTSDLPNRNGIAFPLQELTKFNPDTGQLGYQSWKGKPTFFEHKNDILADAKGVIFDSALLPAPEFAGDIYKLLVLLGFDKKKDPALANDILSKRRNCYSMGAYANDYTCSICGAKVSKGGCSHVNVNYPQFKIIDGNLAFLNVQDIIGFETSSVATPAFPRCIAEKSVDLAKL